MLNGVTSDTLNNLLLGPGVVYRDFQSPATPGTIIGATAGGTTFKVDRTIYTPAIDGVMGSLKGSARVTKEEPSIETTFIDMKKETFLLALSGATADDYGSPATHTKISPTGNISAGNHITIAIIAETSGTVGQSGKPVCLVVKNALSSEPQEVKLDDGKGTPGLKVKFTGYFDQASPTIPPWDIYWPK